MDEKTKPSAQLRVYSDSRPIKAPFNLPHPPAPSPSGEGEKYLVTSPGLPGIRVQFR